MLTQFRLYGLRGCNFCGLAERYLVDHQMPVELVEASDDPIIHEGLQKLTGGQQFPVLVSQPTKEILVGFKPEEYERVHKAFVANSGTSSYRVVSIPEQPQPEASPAPAQAPTGVN